MRTKALQFALTFGLSLCLAGPASAQDSTPAAAPVASQAAAMAAQTQAAEQPVPASLDLKQSVERGLAANPTMVGARAQLQGSDYMVKSSMADFFPTATASYGFSRYGSQPKTTAGVDSGDQTTWTGRLNIHQPVFVGFKLLKTHQKARLTKEQNEANLTQAELSLISTIQTNFLAHLKAKMDVKSAEDSVERLKSQLKVTQAFFDVGLKPKLDVLQAEVDLATAEQAQLKAKNSLDTTRAKLNSLLNLPLEAPVEYVGDLTFTPFNLDLNECLKRAFTSRPDILVGIKSVQIAEKDAGITASDFYPQVGADVDFYKKGDHPGLSGSPNLSNTGKSYMTVGATASWTFFQWGSTFFKYKSADETVNKVRAALDNTRLSAGYEVKQGLLSQREAADRIGVAKKSVDAARESYRMALARYQAQVGTNTDVLDAQAKVSSSEAQLSQALSDYQTAISGLYVAMGEKNPDLSTAK
ncbi:MAG: TolC family protein [Humidesulfovibrio sp.]|uniref:TolC family protein n=1 Tax=Humidesulfovibrio sp. TaxID=2910988 RepID=UPI0027F484E1|nr:TolC family protein [Humidesulfovibrio sp.]MDQ7834114.1 TolC family protein [Humidesulfovibrio sp.]